MLMFIISVVINTIIVLVVLFPFYWIWSFIFMSIREFLYCYAGINSFTRDELKTIYGITINHPGKIEVLPKSNERDWDYFDVEIINRKKRRRR